MKIFDGCLLACDVDGTLLYNGVIPQKNLDSIKFFVENGGRFCLATGRSVGALTTVIEKIPEISVSVLSNGCMIYDYKEQKVLYEKCLDKGDYNSILAVKEKNPEIGIELHSGLEVLVLTRTKETDEHEFYEDLRTEFITKEDIYDFDYNKALYASNVEGDIPKIRKTLESVDSHSLFVNTSVNIGGRTRYYVEQIPKGVTKATGVKRLAEMLKIKDGNLFAVGDYYNDIEMLKIADVSAAPVNSPDDVKKYADCITKEVENGIVADFIDYLAKLRRK